MKWYQDTFVQRFLLFALAAAVGILAVTVVKDPTARQNLGALAVYITGVATKGPGESTPKPAPPPAQVTP